MARYSKMLSSPQSATSFHIARHVATTPAYHDVLILGHQHRRPSAITCRRHHRRPAAGACAGWQNGHWAIDTRRAAIFSRAACCGSGSRRRFRVTAASASSSIFIRRDAGGSLGAGIVGDVILRYDHHQHMMSGAIGSAIINNYDFARRRPGRHLLAFRH